MTEADWLSGADPTRMLTVVGEHTTQRKIRLFGLSCCQRIEYLLNADDLKHCRRVLALLECQIEGSADERELQTALGAAIGDAIDACASIAHPGEIDLYAIASAATAVEVIRKNNWTHLTQFAGRAVAYDSLSDCDNTELKRIVALWRKEGRRLAEPEWGRDQNAIMQLPEFLDALEIEQRFQAKLLRDIFGDPFRPVSFADSWRSETVVALANGIYTDRAFDRLPILADALEEAGCDHPDILDHCRGPGPHVRGCWVVDLVLGKV